MIGPSTSDQKAVGRVRRALESPMLAHLALVASPALIFARPLLRGEVIFSNSDSLFNHYPNMIFGVREFLRGGWGLWNPYIFAGADFSASFHHHLLNPLWWFILLFGERGVIPGVTAVAFASFILAGVLVFHIARPHLTVPWSLLLALMFQASGYMWFTTMTMIATPMTAAALLSIFLIHTYERRAWWEQLVLLSLSLLPIVLSGHIGYIAAFLFVVGGGFLVRQISLGRMDVCELAIFGAAVALAMAIGLFRLVPVVTSVLQHGEALREGLRLPSIGGDDSYLFLPGIIPGSFGYTTTDSVRIGKALDLLKHTQFHTLVSFGVVSLYLTVLAFAGAAGKWARLAAILFVGLGLAQAHTISLLTDLVFLQIYPVLHDVIPKVGAAFAFIPMAALVLRSWGAGYENPHGRTALGGTVIVVLGAIVLMAIFYAKSGGGSDGEGKSFQIGIYAVKLLSYAVIGGIVLLYIAAPLTELARRRMINATLAVCLAILAAIGCVVFLTSYRHVYLVRLGYFYEAAGVVACMGVLLMARLAGRPNQALRFEAQAMAALALIAVALAMILIDMPTGFGGRSRTLIILAGILSALRVLVVCLALVELVGAWQSRPERGPIFAALLLVLALADLHAFNRIYNFTASPPFAAQDRLYPPPYERTPTWLGGGVQGKGAQPLRQSFALPDLIGPDDSAGPGWILAGPGITATSANAEAAPARPLRLSNTSAATATLSAELRPKVEERFVAFGAWVRTADPGVHLRVSTGAAARTSDPHSGSGQWEWLTARSIVERAHTVRVEVAIDSKGSLDLLGPRLAEGRHVVPAVAPPGRGGQPTVAPRDDIDFRVNRPHVLSGQPFGEVISNIPMIYGIRTFGGVDSDIRADFFRLMTALRTPDPSWIARYGMLSTMDDERLLSLFGVRYGFTSDGVPAENPRALPRFALFDAYRVEPSAEAALHLLRQPSFDFERTVLLDRPPGANVEPVAAPRQRELVHYREVTSDRLVLQTHTDRPRLLFFGDAYSPHWRAFYDGRELPVMKANGYFMAIALPAGTGEVLLEFRPQPFLLLLKLSGVLGAALAFGLVALSAGRLRRLYRRRFASAAPI